MEHNPSIQEAPALDLGNFDSHVSFVDGDQDMSIKTRSRVRTFWNLSRRQTSLLEIPSSEDFVPWMEAQRDSFKKRYPDFDASIADLHIGLRRQLRFSHVFAQYWETPGTLKTHEWFRTLDERLNQYLEQ